MEVYVETASTEALPETETEGPKRTLLLDHSRAPECVQTSFCTVRDIDWVGGAQGEGFSLGTVRVILIRAQSIHVREK